MVSLSLSFFEFLESPNLWFCKLEYLAVFLVFRHVVTLELSKAPHSPALLSGETPVGSAGNLVISRPATILPQQPTGGATIHRINVGEDLQAVPNAAHQPASVTLTSQGLLTQAPLALPGNNRPGILRRREGDRDQAGKNQRSDEKCIEFANEF